MAAKEILRMGHPLLLRVSQPVTAFSTPELTAIISDMFDSMAACEGAGIAAPQIGVLQRIIIFGGEKNPRYPDAAPVPRTVLINPIIEQVSDAVEEDWEGCLSVPGMRAWVPRFAEIRYRGYDERGHVVERSVNEFHARVVQHECDHLDGILYPQRIKDMTKFGFIQDDFPPKKEADL